MATIRKRGDRWQVQVRRKGSPVLSRSFLTKADAQTWARQMEAEADRHGLPTHRKVLDKLTMRDLVVRYRDTVTPTKKGRYRETVALNVFLRHKLANVKLSELTLAKVASFRDDRLVKIKPSSFAREVAILSHVLNTARKAWEIPLPSNPFADVPKPKVRDARTRRLKPGEWELLLSACRRSRSKFLLPMVELAVETAMRRGEVLKSKWRDVDFTNRRLHIPETKNDQPRTIPLSLRAIEILKQQQERHPKALPCEAIFPTTEDAVKMAWRKAMGRVNLPDLRYHDLRHEAVSRYFDKGLTIPEAASISGHRDARMLLRYAHAAHQSVLSKLDQRE